MIYYYNKLLNIYHACLKLNIVFEDFEICNLYRVICFLYKGVKGKMTLQQLEYVLAIAQEGTMNKAAQRLYKAQPNISNAIRDLENELNIRIFERTSKGMILTPEGEEFVVRANGILQETNQLQSYFKNEGENQLTLKIAVARSSYMTVAVSEWVNSYVKKSDALRIYFTETNTNSVIESVSTGKSDLGIIRIPSDYQEFYDKLLDGKKISKQILMEFPMRIVVKKNHPLAGYEDIPYERLGEYTEIVHGDDHFPIIMQLHINPEMDIRETKGNKIFVYDRGSQISFLDKITNSYMWVSPIPLDMLQPFDMVLKDCSFAKNKNRDIIIMNSGSLKNPHIKNCVRYLKTFASNLEYDTEHRESR